MRKRIEKRGDPKMRKTYCSVCGKMMNEKIDENSGKPFKIQMCSVSCISERGIMSPRH